MGLAQEEHHGTPPCFDEGIATKHVNAIQYIDPAQIQSDVIARAQGR
jgi:hypothetical protein